ncbi:hypothetical protein DSM106972_047010 [Dulcicalothrix desertica PCC 7102]|uniref:Uncharacterized protein n=1 Tax=Dulcicalothrix desertica PCC 7102 TaxID=232991 RepID=A0A3S1ALD2_9CYAN|nr:hypothetical protein [Dulcicalothrix desertica]RUT03787.1 hypothetical protein DSM106972_047010 [Dulcicalothrix desertica PCC 7102]TWH43806.1 hypothetical protein CAL7102_07550 [Dulcicalothrix desertica PCC 7102]
MKKSPDVKSQHYAFVNKQTASELTGLSAETLKKYRLAGKLEKGIHWVEINCRVVRYNISLVLDWIQNHDENPQGHIKAIENYLASLPSSQKQTRCNR